MHSSVIFASSAFDGFVIDLILKSAIVLTASAALASGLTFARRSAATRHLVWSLGIMVVLLLPALTALLPSRSIALPWSWNGSAGRADHVAKSIAQDQLVLAWSDSEVSRPTDMARVASEPQSATERIPIAISSIPDLAPKVSARWAYATWLLGFVMSLVPACLGFASLWSLAKRSILVTSGRLQQALQEASRQLGLGRLPRLLTSDARAMPMTWGIWRATVLLPKEAVDWSDERLKVVLLHELAHVRRRDCLIQTLAQLARAVYWFNPLVWLAERRIRVEQELACDDQVLDQGFRPSEYAAHLLDVLAHYRSPAFGTALGLAMARSSKLERRLKSILGACENRRSLTPTSIATAIAFAVMLLGAMSTVHIQTVHAGSEAAQQQDKKTPADQVAADRVKTWAELRNQIADQYVGVVNDQAMEQGIIKGMLQSLNDPYSDFMTADMIAEMEKHIGGSLVGIGVQLEVLEQQIRVVTPLPNSPALQAGIQPGDVILQLDGHAFGKPDVTDAVKRIAGREGTVVRLKIRRDAIEKDIEVKRGPIKLASVKGFHRDANNRWNYLLANNPNPKIGYIQITQFGSQTPLELREALDALKGQEVAGLILDLRFCPGGLLDAAVATAKQFISSGTIVSLHARTGEPITIKADATATLGDVPMVVLVNHQTASAAEVVAGALQDNQRAMVVGTRTHGKGSVQTLIKLAGTTGAIRLTTSSYHLPSGRNIDRQPNQAMWGVHPNDGYFVPMDGAQTKALSDRRAARDVIGSKSSQPEIVEAPITPVWLEQQAADPQLAAALKTLTDRVKTGAFTKVNDLSSTQIDQFLKRQEIEQRRESILQSLQKVDRELAELENK